MYYLLTTDRIVTERHMQDAFEISHGAKVDEYPVHYKAWTNSLMSVKAAIPEEKATVEMLVKRNCLVEAVRLYKEKHDCTLLEARDAVNEIKANMLNQFA